MSLHDDIITDADNSWFNTDDFAQAATYRAKGSATTSSVTVLMVQTEDAELSKTSRGEAYYAQQARLYAKKSEVANPGAGDVFIIGADTWVVQDLAGGNALAWGLNVYRSAQAGKVR